MTTKTKVDAPFYDLDFGSEVRGRWLTNDLAIYHLRPGGEPCGGLVIVEGPKARHSVQNREPLSIEPSILCPIPECQRHGWIRAGRWVDSGEGYG